MQIQRTVFEELEKEQKNEKITALVGPRQVGKTTLLKKLHKNEKNSTYITFDDLDILHSFEEDIKLFIEKYIEPYKTIFIDEFQYAKEGGKKLKFIHDTNKQKIFISGSSQPELAIQSFQYLVGRISIIEIFPLTFKEFLEYKTKDKILLKNIRKQQSFTPIQRYFEEYLQYGGFPDCVLAKEEEEKKKILKNIVNSYLLKEIKDILDYKNIYEFENVLRRLALQDSKLLNKSSIAQSLDINFKKITEILSVLNKTYLISLLQPFLKNKIKEQIKSPKTILLDLGIKNQLINNFNRKELRLDKGQILENFIFNQLIRQGIRPKFFNEQKRYEMDFVFEQAGEIIGFECKSSFKKAKPNKSMLQFIKKFKPKLIIVFNEDIDAEITYEGCKILFTNHINVFQTKKIIEEKLKQ